jgi:hypothetical protein
MQPGEALGIIAQVAVTLAGFAGIVVVFRPESLHRWSELDKFRLRLLLSNSALPLADALFGMLLLAVNPTPANIWRWCSGVGFAAQLLVIIRTGNPERKISPPEMEGANKSVFYAVATLGTAALLLQIVNVLIWNLFWPFFALIIMHLIAALAQFVRMVLLPADNNS